MPWCGTFHGISSFTQSTPSRTASSTVAIRLPNPLAASVIGQKLSIAITRDSCPFCPSSTWVCLTIPGLIMNPVAPCPDSVPSVRAGASSPFIRSRGKISPWSIGQMIAACAAGNSRCMR